MNELRNIKTYKIYSVFNNLLILGPIITLYYLEKGLNFTEIFSLASIASITTVLFEVPTGAISDKYSRKLSLVIGSLLCGIGLLIFVIAPSFIIIALGEVIFSIGLTFRSGSEQAILYDSLKNNNCVSEFALIEGQARSYAFIAQAIGSLAAGFLFTLNIHLPFIISVIFMGVAASIALSFNEPAIEYHEKEISYVNQIKGSFVYTFSNKKVFSIIIFGLVLTYFYRIGFNYFQPYMKTIGIPTVYFGVIFFLFNIVAAYASKNAQNFMNITKPRSLMVLSMLLVVSFLFMSIIKTPIGFLLILLQQLVRGLRQPIFQKYINKHIPSDKRATILSIQNLSNALLLALFAPFAGYLLDKTDIFRTHLIIACIMFTLVILVNQFMKYSIDRPTKVG